MCAHTVNSLPFHKMHGLGNDFIMLDLREGFGMPSPQQLRMLADRRLGIGCDQIMVLSDTQNAGDIHLDMFNADGSVAGACGNGTRCVAWFEMQKNGKDALEIETISGMLYAHKTSDDLITVNMGKPRFSWAEIPLVAEMDAQRLAFETMPFGSAFCVNMGNPHAVFIVPDAEEVEVEKWGAFMKHTLIFQIEQISNLSHRLPIIHLECAYLSAVQASPVRVVLGRVLLVLRRFHLASFWL